LSFSLCSINEQNKNPIKNGDSNNKNTHITNIF
jgi:hypothetical protein